MNVTAEARDAQGVGQSKEKELEAGVAHFLGEHAGARAAHIANLETHGFSLSSFRPAAALFGPLWAASRGLWTPFWIAMAVEAAWPHRSRALLVVRRIAGDAGSAHRAVRREHRGAARGPGASGRIRGLDALARVAAVATRGRHGGRDPPGERGARGDCRARPRRGLGLALRHPGRAGVSPGLSPRRASSSAPPRSGSTVWSTGWW